MEKAAAAAESSAELVQKSRLQRGAQHLPPRAAHPRRRRSAGVSRPAVGVRGERVARRARKARLAARARAEPCERAHARLWPLPLAPGSPTTPHARREICKLVHTTRRPVLLLTPRRAWGAQTAFLPLWVETGGLQRLAAGGFGPPASPPFRVRPNGWVPPPDPAGRE
ncbi:hypothetical protein T492DRAFT_832186 [Pavlovales sp. CCMP2436]|nr:hypothetical protein T492DRAFT_832186 [Pavlovales sp. CCMP2436]